MEARETLYYCASSGGITNAPRIVSFSKPSTAGFRTPETICTSKIFSALRSKSRKPTTEPVSMSTTQTPHFRPPLHHPLRRYLDMVRFYNGWANPSYLTRWDDV